MTPDDHVHSVWGGPGGYRAGCPGCQALRRETHRTYRAVEEHRAATRAAGNKQSARNRARSDEEADAAFQRLHGDSKVCAACLADLPMASFYRDRSQSDGRQPYCRPCKAARQRARRAAKAATLTKETP